MLLKGMSYKQLHSYFKKFSGSVTREAGGAFAWSCSSPCR